jgi:hypothetical protein
MIDQLRGVNLMNALLSWVLADVPAPPPVVGPWDQNKLLYLGAGVGMLFLLVVVVWITRGKKKVDPEAGLAENLAEYPPPPAGGKKRVTVQGAPGRLRLVVVAPVGKKTIAPDAAVEPLLDRLVRGLGEQVRQDKPRVRVWPPQLSNQGFPPMFHRLTHRPEAPGQPSPYVLLAGTARVDGQQLLLGLAVRTDQPTRLDHLTLEPLEWAEALSVESE